MKTSIQFASNAVYVYIIPAVTVLIKQSISANFSHTITPISAFAIHLIELCLHVSCDVTARVSASLPIGSLEYRTMADMRRYYCYS